METETAAAPSMDALLADLNGEMPAFVGAPIVPDANRDAQLTVAAPVVLSPIKAADAVHATKAGGRGWKVTVKGEYLADSPSGRGKIKKDYCEEFNLPNLDAALSVIKNKLLEPRLRKKHSDFVNVRTNKIVDALPMSPETPLSNNLQYMSRNQLAVHIAQIRAPIDVAAYPDVVDLRDAVIDYTQTPGGFEKRETLKQAERAENRALAELNPDVANTIGE